MWEDDETGMGEDRCVFPGRCLMPGFHLSSECHTVEMVEAWEREMQREDAAQAGDPVGWYRVG